VEPSGAVAQSLILHGACFCTRKTAAVQVQSLDEAYPCKLQHDMAKNVVEQFSEHPKHAQWLGISREGHSSSCTHPQFGKNDQGTMVGFAGYNT
jgi:hypothetical protein